MGYRSDVTILAQEGAYKMIMDSIKEFNKTASYEFKPYSIKTGEDGYIGKFYLLTWNCIKWYRDYKDVLSVESVLNELVKKHQDEKGFGFKQIIIGEDDYTEEKTNSDFLDCFLYTIHHVALDSNADLEEV